MSFINGVADRAARPTRHGKSDASPVTARDSGRPASRATGEVFQTGPADVCGEHGHCLRVLPGEVPRLRLLRSHRVGDRRVRRDRLDLRRLRVFTTSALTASIWASYISMSRSCSPCSHLIDGRERLVEDGALAPARIDQGDVDAPLPQLESQRVAHRFHRELRRVVAAVSGSTSRPPIEPTFTMRPVPCRMSGRNAWSRRGVRTGSPRAARGTRSSAGTRAGRAARCPSLLTMPGQTTVTDRAADCLHRRRRSSRVR